MSLSPSCIFHAKNIFFVTPVSYHLPVKRQIALFFEVRSKSNAFAFTYVRFVMYACPRVSKILVSILW